MKSVISSFFIVVLLSGCDNRAEPVEDEAVVAPQQQHERGQIDTHGTD
ncbi:MAG: hypothetical protein MUP09_07490 [Thiovulaceae bacterium]|nr:hypothetical protein [Sulfurimonadaceae bacterium]